jgi:hypothetical protein
MSVGLTFKLVRMQQRFIDRAAADHLHPVIRRFFMRAGGAIRITARRLLKKAGKKNVGELNRTERHNYETALRLFRSGRRKEIRSVKQGRWQQNLATKPTLPHKTASPGKPPLLHSTWDNGTSPLKNRLWFALRDSNKNELVVGPAAIGRNRTNTQRGITTLNELERRHPFMEPAFLAIQPRFADYLQQAAR